LNTVMFHNVFKELAQLGVEVPNFRNLGGQVRYTSYRGYLDRLDRGAYSISKEGEKRIENLLAPPAPITQLINNASIPVDEFYQKTTAQTQTDTIVVIAHWYKVYLKSQGLNPVMFHNAFKELAQLGVKVPDLTDLKYLIRYTWTRGYLDRLERGAYAITKTGEQRVEELLVPPIVPISNPRLSMSEFYTKLTPEYQYDTIIAVFYWHKFFLNWENVNLDRVSKAMREITHFGVKQYRLGVQVIITRNKGYLNKVKRGVYTISEKGEKRIEQLLSISG